VTELVSPSREAVAQTLLPTADVRWLWQAADMSELPESVAWFVRQLRDSGFTQVEDEAGSMDSRLLAFDASLSSCG
jgi:hypothetical protein